MRALVGAVSLTEWILFGIALLALLISLLAYRRSGQAIRQLNKKTAAATVVDAEPSPASDERPEVALELLAERDENEQVSLALRNSGSLSIKQLKLRIEPPERIFNAEGISQGVEQADVSASSAIMPRLAVLDADNRFPLDEILPDNQVVLPAVLTMAFGKICDFPVVVRWVDGKGRSQQHKYRLTI